MLLKRLDRVFGALLVRLLPQPVRATVRAPFSRLLLIRPGGIGDAVLLVPAILAIKEAFPSLRVEVLAEKRNHKIFSLCPDVAETRCYDKPGDFARVLGRCYDVVIDTEQWHYLSAFVARVIRSPIKIGFATNPRRKMFTDSLSYFHDDYEVASFARLLDPLGIPFVPPLERFLTVPGPARGRAGELLRGLDEQRLVALFPGASIAERRWGAEKFRNLAGMLRQSGCSVVAVGGPEDRAAGEIIAAEGNVRNFAGQTSLVESAAIIERATLLISGDSGILHVGVGLGRPTVSLFGSGIAKKWAPSGERHRVINLDLPCSPCTRFGTTPRCPIGVKCLRDITVERVFQEANDLLSGVAGD